MPAWGSEYSAFHSGFFPKYPSRDRALRNFSRSYFTSTHRVLQRPTRLNVFLWELWVPHIEESFDVAGPADGVHRMTPLLTPCRPPVEGTLNRASTGVVRTWSSPNLADSLLNLFFLLTSSLSFAPCPVFACVSYPFN